MFQTWACRNRSLHTGFRRGPWIWLYLHAWSLLGLSSQDVKKKSVYKRLRISLPICLSLAISIVAFYCSATDSAKQSLASIWTMFGRLDFNMCKSPKTGATMFVAKWPQLTIAPYHVAVWAPVYVMRFGRVMQHAENYKMNQLEPVCVWAADSKSPKRLSSL